MTAPLPPATRERLAGVSTATLTTALFRRGLRNTFVQGVSRINPSARRMVGEAATLRYIPAREDLDTLDAFADRGHPQRRAVEEIRPGQVMAIDSRQDPRAASAGGILVARMAARGAAGVVTDGGFRDTPDIAAMDFPAYHARPSAPTNLVAHHAVDINVPIGCGGVAVFPGDVIVGDNEGVVVIPRGLAEDVADEAAEMTVFEDFVAAEVARGASVFGLYPPTDPGTAAKFADWRRAGGR